MITIEKLLILKSVKLFEHTPDDVLLELASSLTEVNYLVGETIIHKGEYGSSMFIIVSGKAKILDGETTLAEVGEYDYFGELAVLSPEARIATVVVTEELLALKVTSSVLYELMNLDIGLVKGIILELCDRYRTLAEMNVKR
jgi:CRP-like cAMP-binding protein